MEYEEKINLEPVTALIVRQIKPGCLSDFEEWAKGMRQVVRKFEGYLGSDHIRPSDSLHPEFVIVVRFDNYEHLKAFLRSKEREDYIKQSDNLTVGDMNIQEQNGFESWFSLPDHSVNSIPPAKYKMAILTILVLYPSLLVVSTFISGLLHSAPRPIIILVTLLVLVPMMTYFIMPWITRIFRFWLYPQHTSTQQNPFKQRRGV